jgi:uncharacterized protein YodC (DUF2158 family)
MSKPFQIGDTVRVNPGTQGWEAKVLGYHERSDDFVLCAWTDPVGKTHEAYHFARNLIKVSKPAEKPANKPAENGNDEIEQKVRKKMTTGATHEQT